MRKKSGMAKLLYLSVALCLLFSVIISGCDASDNSDKDAKATNAPANSANPAATGPTPGGTVKFIMSSTATNIGFPATDAASFTLYYNRPALESLGRYDGTGKMTPFLAESWQSDSKAKTITFKIKQGIKFQDGTDFNAEAVKWNIEQYVAAKRPEVKGIQSIQVIDASTVQLNLASWDIGLLDSIAYFVLMVSPAAWKRTAKTGRSVIRSARVLSTLSAGRKMFRSSLRKMKIIGKRVSLILMLSNTPSFMTLTRRAMCLNPGAPM